MKIKYIAYDETEFDTREECERYEERHSKIISSIIFLNSSFNKCEYDEADYVFSPNLDSHRFLLNEYGIALPKSFFGWFIYNYEDDYYRPFLDEFAKAKEKYHTFLEAKKELEKI